MSGALEEVLDRARHRDARRVCADVPAWLIYGAGNIGQALAATLVAGGRKVEGFIDRRTVALQGHRVFQAGAALELGAPRVPVVIAVHNPYASVAAIRTQLLREGFTEVWTLPEVIDTWPALAHFWLAPASAVLDRAAEVTAAHAMLADEGSRALLVAILRQRLLGDHDALPEPDFRHQYFPPDLPALPRELAYVDCGAFTGDTLHALQGAGVRFTRVAAFEPDPPNYAQLVTAARGLDAALFPCGVWDRLAQLRFSSDGSAGHLSEHGEVVVQVVSLDEALPSFQPDLVKMDIEGAEPRALEGGRAMIARTRPRLAVSTYHAPEHLFSLLLQIDSWGLGYRYFLRSHAHNSFETVLYALP
jgi:FkbM family methyltransferase